MDVLRAAYAGEGTEEDADPKVWPDMVDSWRLFMGMATQWETASFGMAGSMRTGLRYAALETVARSMGIPYPLPAPLFSDLRFMEAEALSIWSRKRG